MKVSGGIRIDIAAADGFTVSLSKYAHSYGVTAAGTLKESLDTGLIKVSVKNGKTQLICPSTSTSQPSTNGTYKVTSIVIGLGMTVSKSISGNQFVFWPASYTAAGPVTMNLTIVAMWEGVDYTFTQEVTFSKTSDGREGSNYLYMGWWDPSITYRKTDLGIPMVKKAADGTTLGYSVYALKVAESTPVFFFPPEWDLMESADFIYMEQAYIERLQAEIITADRINAMDITSRRVLAIDANNNKVASMNEFGDGAYIQYYPSGRKRMEFGGGLIIYYKDDAFNTELWTLGQSGSIHTTSLDRWGERYLLATDTNGTNVQKKVLPGGIMYKEFKPGSSSIYMSYLGLTVKNTVNSSTTPDNVPSGSYIPTGWYTNPSIAMLNQDDPPYTFRRTLIYFYNGKQTTSKEIVFTDYGDGLPAE